VGAVERHGSRRAQDAVHQGNGGLVLASESKYEGDGPMGEIVSISGSHLELRLGAGLLA